MAKMFYTMDETRAALGRDEEGIKQLAREGRLREFRDGPRLMFKADQVEQLKVELTGGATEDINLTPAADSGAPLRLAGDSSFSGAATPADSGAVPSPGSGSGTGSGSGLLNIGSGSGIGTGSGTGPGGSRGGITVFEVDDSQKVDPSAQTAINANVQSQVNLEGTGSGSGLLDLTRESDDTSLGAVFDELTPGGSGRRAAQTPAAAALEPRADAGLAAIDRAARTTLVAPVTVEGGDAWTTALGAASLMAAIIVCCGAFALITTIMGYRPEVLNSVQQSGAVYLGLAAGLTLIVMFIGLFVGKRST